MGTIFLLAPIALGILTVIFVRVFADQHSEPHEPLTSIMIAYRRLKLLRFVVVINVILITLLITAVNVLSIDLTEKPSWDPRCLTILVGIVISLFDGYVWRCPQCREYLGRVLNPRFCWSCAARLR